MKEIPIQLTVKQASQIFNIPENTLRAYIHRKVIPHRRLLGKIYFVTEKLEEWLSSFDVEATRDGLVGKEQEDADS